MKIFFSPSYTSATYLDMDAMPGCIAMDTSVCDVAGLVSLIELHSGIYYPEMSVYELQVEYMKALKKMDDDKPDNVLHNSLVIDAISTAKTCLDWREKLILSGWTSSITTSKRLEAIAEAEKYFDYYTLADRIMQLPDIIKSSGIAKDIELVIPYDHHLMHPAISAIISTLKDNGTTVEVMPDTAINPYSNLAKLGKWYEGAGDINSITCADDTVKVVEFENREKVVEWLATLDKSDNEVWISDHCADIDRAMIAHDKPACGSMTDAGLPSTVQTAMLAVSLFMSPVDINKLVAWLRLPRSPLPKVSLKIASMLLKEGGYHPEKLEECLNDYKKNNPEADITAIRNGLKKYLYISNGKDASNKEFTKFIKNLLDWAEEQCASEYMAELHAQYNDLISRLKAILLLADMYTADTIDNATLEKWMMMCGDTSCYPQYAAQKGAHNVISNPGNIIANAGHVLWCSFSDFTPQHLTYDFLSQTEIRAIKEHGCNIYEPDVEAAALRIEQQWPLHHCNHLTIIEMAEKGKDEVRGIMSQQLKSIPKEVWDVLKIGTPSVTSSATITSLDANFFNGMPTEIQISKSTLMKFRNEESYSSLELLVQRPLDYTMKYVLGIKSISDNEIDINTSLGNVAHYVIENIFTAERSVDDIKESWEKEFDTLLNEGLMQKGMIVLLPENRIELVRLEAGLKKAIAALIDIMEKSGLTVIDCENTFVSDKHLPNGTNIQAKLDMRLRRADGGQAIIDLKWTGRPYSYYEKVRDELAMQLDIYTSVLSKVPEGDTILFSGYFVMPICKLYTCCDGFKGKEVEFIDIAHNPDAFMDKIINSYIYRREQLANGIIEMGYGLPTKDIQYGIDAEAKSLYPLKLKTSSKNKAENSYSDYKPFNS